MFNFRFRGLPSKSFAASFFIKSKEVTRKSKRNFWIVLEDILPQVSFSFLIEFEFLKLTFKYISFW